jgi:hypothetical protein
MLSKERQIVNGFGVFLRYFFQLPYYCTVKALESQGLSAFFRNKRKTARIRFGYEPFDLPYG